MSFAVLVMLRDIREERLNCVLAYKIDRLTRSVKDFHLLRLLPHPSNRTPCSASLKA